MSDDIEQFDILFIDEKNNVLYTIRNTTGSVFMYIIESEKFLFFCHKNDWSSRKSKIGK